MEKYRVVYKDLYYKIKSGKIATGELLPTEEKLAEQYGVSRITVKTALNLLKAEGLVTRIRHKGTVVLRGEIRQPTEGRLIAIVFSGFDHLDIRIVNGLRQIAAKQNFRICFFDTESNVQKERETLQFLLSENIAGLIFMPLSRASCPDVISLFAVQKIPVVDMDFPTYALRATTVTSDNFGGMHAITEYLIRQGHRTIGFFPYHDRYLPTESARFEGYCHALVENGIPVNPDYLFTAPFPTTYSLIASYSSSDSDAAEEFFREYSRLPQKPTAIACVNDICAHALISVCKKHGVRVPEDLSVTGFDNLGVSAQANITTVAQDFAEIAKIAVSALLRKIDGNEKDANEIRIHTVLIRRETVLPCRTED